MRVVFLLLSTSVSVKQAVTTIIIKLIILLILHIAQATDKLFLLRRSLQHSV